MNGRTNPIAKKDVERLELLSRLVLRKLLEIMRKIIIKVSIVSDMMIAVDTKFFVLYLLVDIRIFSAVGRPNCAILLSSKKVGIIIEYSPIPSVPINLVSTIFILIPRSLVKKPPTISIKVDFINLLFIVQVYSKKI